VPSPRTSRATYASAVRLAAVVLARVGPAAVADVRRRLALPFELDQAADRARRRVLARGLGRPGDPVLGDEAVVVDERDPLAAGLGHTAAPRGGQPLLGLAHDPQRERALVLQPREQRRGGVRAVVVDDEHLPVDARRNGLAGERAEHALERGDVVVGAHDDVDADADAHASTRS